MSRVRHDFAALGFVTRPAYNRLQVHSGERTHESWELTETGQIAISTNRCLSAYTGVVIVSGVTHSIGNCD